MTDEPTTPPDTQRGIEDDLLELQLLLPTPFRALRRGGPDPGEVELLKRAFFEAGLRERHGRLLLVVASAGPLTIGELAARAALAPAMTSLLVGELDRAGFLERQEDDADRRPQSCPCPTTCEAPSNSLPARASNRCGAPSSR